MNAQWWSTECAKLRRPDHARRVLRSGGQANQKSRTTKESLNCLTERPKTISDYS